MKWLKELCAFWDYVCYGQFGEAVPSNDFDEIKFNDADEHDGLAEVDKKCPHCHKYMREQSTQFEGQRDMIAECVGCPMKYTKSI